jgi:hypothetical protein
LLDGYGAVAVFAPGKDLESSLITGPLIVNVVCHKEARIVTKKQRLNHKGHEEHEGKMGRRGESEEKEFGTPSEFFQSPYLPCSLSNAARFLSFVNFVVCF